jgi:hypothetical protein
MEPALPPQTPIPATPPQTQSITPTPIKSNSSPLMVFVMIILLLALGATGFFAYQNWQLRQKIFQIQSVPTPTLIITPSSSQDSTSTWNVYKNSNPSYSIRYPLDWTIDTTKAKQNEETGAQLTIYKDGYKLVIDWPTGFGPGVCVFSDNPLFGKEKEGPIGDCVGNFIQFNSISQVFRRLEKPDLIPPENPTSASWGIYTKDKGGNFVTVPPIQYTAPINYDEKIVKIMDQILSTYTSMN